MLNHSRLPVFVGSLLVFGLVARVAAAQSVPAADDLGRVKLHIDTDNRYVQLRQVVAEGIQMVPYVAITQSDLILCRAPCDQSIDGHLGQEFYFTGQGVTDSHRFNLLDYRGPTAVRVDAGSQPLRTLSKVSFFSSLPIIGIGSLFFINSYQSKPMDDIARQWNHVGLGMMVGGGVLMLSGLIMYFTSGTSYEFRPVAAQSAESQHE